MSAPRNNQNATQGEPCYREESASDFFTAFDKSADRLVEKLAAAAERTIEHLAHNLSSASVRMNEPSSEVARLKERLRESERLREEQYERLVKANVATSSLWSKLCPTCKNKGSAATVSSCGDCVDGGNYERDTEKHYAAVRNAVNDLNERKRELELKMDAKLAQFDEVWNKLCTTCKHFQGGECIVCDHGYLYECASEEDFAVLREEVETLRGQLGASAKELEEARKVADQYDALLAASHEETMEARRNLLEYELLLDCVSSCNGAFQKKHASSLERRVSTIIRSYVKSNVRPYSPKESD